MPRYTIRVYGLWVNDKQEVLLSDERIGETEFTKFPGGGMEKGEGALDCLKREWLEELNTEIEILSHFYTTEFYQPSAFHKETQVISIYYLIKPISGYNIRLAQNKANFTYQEEREESVRFVSIDQLQPDHLNFPIDQHVVELLKENARK